jgi:hypothetical protein
VADLAPPVDVAVVRRYESDVVVVLEVVVTTAVE